jgi:hypothetical protein
VNIVNSLVTPVSAIKLVCRRDGSVLRRALGYRQG